MESSRLMVRHFALDLSDVALAIEETIPQLTNRKTKAEARDRLKCLRERLEDMADQPGMAESLRVHLNEGFSLEVFISLFERLQAASNREDVLAIQPEVSSLVDTTWENLGEIRRSTRDLKSPFRHR